MINAPHGTRWQSPLWVRPAEAAGGFAIAHGRRTEAYRYLSRIRAADPDAAVELEMAFAREEGDLSRVVQIGRHPDNIDVVNSSAAGLSLVLAIRELGFVRESLLIDYAQPFERSIHLRQLPDIRTILAQTREHVGTSEEILKLQLIVLELARTNRHSTSSLCSIAKGAC